ncbi:hypothetical protein [Nisaea sp.]|uniref:hypothetical protein n=1 Tax=Nisaea sp. TaxID=2024842 RepID=UPI0032EBEF8A
MTWSDQEKQEVLNEIVKRAAADDGFRSRCLADAHGVIEEVAGKPVPDDVTVVFAAGPGTAGKDDEVVIVLPDTASGGELSDDMLQSVSGGFLDRGRREHCNQGSSVEV